MVYGGKPAGLDGGRHPQTAGGAECMERLAKPGQLGGGGQAVGHELNFIHDPEGVVVQ